MSLSCSCGEFDGEGWWYYDPSDFTTLWTKRARRCCSCNAPLRPGNTVLEFKRARAPRDVIEERIFGECEDIDLPSWWMCEECGGLFFSITELGFCVLLEKGESMRELAKLTSSLL